MSNIFDAFNRRFSTESEGSEIVGNGEGVAPEQNDSNVEISPEGETLDASDTLEGQHAEAESAEVEVDEAAHEHEAVEQTAEAVESFLVASIEARQAGQYWSAQTAAMTERGLQAVVMATGGNGNFRVRQLSGENFSDRRDAESAMISFENAVTDMLKNLWQKLKDMLKKIYRKVRDFFIKHFSAVGMLKKRAEAIKKKAQNLDKAPGTKKITCAALAQIHDDGKVPGGAFLSNAMNLYTICLSAASGGQTSSKHSEILDTVADMIEDQDMVTKTGGLTIPAALSSGLLVGPTFFKLWLTSAIAMPNGVTANDKHFGVDQSRESASYSDLLPGGFVILGATSTINSAMTPSDLKYFLANTRLVITQGKEKTKEYSTDKEVSPLKAGEIIQISTSVADFCEEALQFKNAYEKYEKANDRFIAKMDKIANGRAGNDDDSNQQNARVAIASGASAYSKNVISWIKSINSHGVRTGRASLDFCNASLNAPRKD